MLAKKFMIFAVALLLCGSTVSAAIFTSKATGNWETEGQATWNEAGHPVAGDTVTVSNDVTLGENAACAELTIDDGGEVDTSAGDHSLTVSGHILVENGTLTGNDSAISCASMRVNNDGTYDATTATTTVTNETSSYAFYVNTSGSLNHNNGTFLFDYDSTTDIRIRSGDHFYNVTKDGAGLSYVSNEGWIVDNDLTVLDGDLCPINLNPLTVLGDTVVTNAYLGHSTSAGAWSLYSLTIQNGGTFKATSGTTTMGGDFSNDGTFTHQSGNVTFTNAAAVDNDGEAFYDLTVDAGSGKMVTLALGTVSGISNLLHVVSGTCHTDDMVSPEPTGAGIHRPLGGGENTMICELTPQIDADATLETGNSADGTVVVVK